MLGYHLRGSFLPCFIIELSLSWYAIGRLLRRNMKSFFVLISDEITTQPELLSTSIALSKLKAGRLMLWKIFRLNLIPNATVVKINNEVKQNPCQPSPKSWREMKTSIIRNGTVLSINIRFSLTGGLFARNVIAFQPG